MHTKDFPHKCQLCTKGFLRKDKLAKHEKEEHAIGQEVLENIDPDPDDPSVQPEILATIESSAISTVPLEGQIFEGMKELAP